MWSRERDLDKEEGYSRSQGKLREGMVGMTQIREEKCVRVNGSKGGGPRER